MKEIKYISSALGGAAEHVDPALHCFGSGWDKVSFLPSKWYSPVFRFGFSLRIMLIAHSCFSYCSETLTLIKEFSIL